MKPANIIDIPATTTETKREANRDRADQKGLDHCPCCGKAIENPKFFINSIYGGCMYPANDKAQYADAWVMGVGSECRKKLPEGYVFQLPE